MSTPSKEASARSYEEVKREFFAMESELGLFEERIDAVPFWERIRFEVDKRILRETSVFGDPHPADTSPTRLERALDHLRGVTTHNPFLADADVVVFGHPRRKRLADGDYWNLHCDPVIDGLEARVVDLEAPLGHGHARPTRTETVRYLDPIELTGRLRRRFASADLLESDDRALLDDVRAEIEDRFGVAVDVESMVESDLLRRRSRLGPYLALLDRIDPDIVVLTVSYGAIGETAIEACKRADVPVVELQHGVIDPFHTGYSFPGSRSKAAFPDHLLVFGRFWRDSVEYPIPDERVHPVGFPHLESRLRGVDEPDSTGPSNEKRLVFVSQGSIGPRLSRFAAAFAESGGFDGEIVYKLHPTETSYPWLEAAPLSVSGPESALYELFAGADAQVGVYSTAVYEGLCFGLRTYVADLPGASRLRPLVEAGAATVVSSIKELLDAETAPDSAEAIDRARFFEPDAHTKAPKTVEALRAAAARR